MGRPQQRSDQEILAVARTCFLEHGPGVTTAVIARQAGVSQASLFQRFGSKEELMISALIPFDRPPWADRVEAGPRQGDLRAQIESMVAGLFAFVKEMSPCFNVLHAAGIPPERLFDRYQVPPPVQASRAVGEWFRKADRMGLARVENPDHVAMALMGALHGRAVLRHSLGKKLGGKDDRRYLATVIDLVWNTVKPESR